MFRKYSQRVFTITKEFVYGYIGHLFTTGTKMSTSLGYGGEFLYSRLHGIHKRRSNIIIVQVFEKLLSNTICFEIQHQTNMLNNIWVGSWWTSQDTSPKIFALDPDGRVRVRKDRMATMIFVNMIVSWWMSQGSAKIRWKMQYLWTQLYNVCVYDRMIFVNTSRSWQISQGSLNIKWRILSLWIQSFNIC